ncbi:MAG: NUDIX hydrolase [Microgenomates group bacterium]
MDIGVSAVVFNKNKTKVLVQKREDLKIWTIPGGKVEKGESLLEAVIRETYEETGIKIKPLKVSGIYFRNLKFFPTLNITFICLSKGGKLKTDPKENLEVAWMEIKEALKKTTPPSPLKIKDALNIKKAPFYRVFKGLNELPKELRSKWIIIQIKRKIKRLFLNR